MPAAFKLVRSNGTCPASFSPLDLESVCKTVAGVANKTYGGIVKDSTYPASCYWNAVTSGIYFNTLAVGADNFFSRLICVGAADARKHRAACDASHPSVHASSLLAPCIIRTPCKCWRLRLQLR